MVQRIRLGCLLVYIYARRFFRICIRRRRSILGRRRFYVFIFVRLSFHMKPLNCISFKRKPFLSEAHLTMRIFDLLFTANRAPFLERKFCLRIQFAIEWRICKSGKEVEKGALTKGNTLRWIRCVHRVQYILSIWFIATPYEDWGSGSTLSCERIHLRDELLPLPSAIHIKRDNVCCWCCCRSCYVQCGALCAYNQPASHPTTRAFDCRWQRQQRLHNPIWSYFARLCEGTNEYDCSRHLDTSSFEMDLNTHSSASGIYRN